MCRLKLFEVPGLIKEGTQFFTQVVFIEDTKPDVTWDFSILVYV